MPTPIYVPILKGKEGEFAALEALNAEVRSRLTPLIEIPEIPFDYSTELPAKTLDEHLADIPSRLKRACGALPFYLDVQSLKRTRLVNSTQTVLGMLMAKSFELGALPMPVVSLVTLPEHLSAARTHVSGSQEGAGIRLFVRDFNEESDLDSEVDRVLESSAFDPASTDLIIDLEFLGEDSGKATIIARSVLSMIPKKELWRRVILAAASFPQDLSDVSADTTVILPRHEWKLWTSLQRRVSMLPRRDLIFGDYAMAHPISKTLDPRTMQMSANIRYTTEDAWLIVKGRTVKKYGFSQYFDLCRELTEREEYCGRAFSWGDGYIMDCAEATQGPGNATTWRKVGVNHHLTLLARELSNPRSVASDTSLKDHTILRP